MRTLIVVAAALLAASSASAAAPGSINCAKAKTPDEKTICASYDLGQMDAVLATLYNLLKGFLAMGGRGALMDEQHVWLLQRAACKADIKCLKGVYQSRIDALQTGLDRVKSYGPF